MHYLNISQQVFCEFKQITRNLPSTQDLLRKDILKSQSQNISERQQIYFYPSKLFS